MSGNDSSNTTYTMGYDESFRQMLNWRSVETHASHLLPHLQPGQSILDFGCGPGTISVGLARAVEPGEFHGIDIEESQIQLARAAAAAGGHTNATFHVGDVSSLPFDDGTFDVAHCHAVLNHIPDTAAALAEVKRVLKSGGVISSRELIAAASFGEPGEGLEGAWELFTNLITANGGHPQMGKHLKGRFADAGFTDIRATASFDIFSTPEAVAFYQRVIDEWFFSPKIVTAATAFGLATEEDFEQWRAILEGMSDDPGAMAALAFGEAIGVKP